MIALAWNWQDALAGAGALAFLSVAVLFVIGVHAAVYRLIRNEKAAALIILGLMFLACIIFAGFARGDAFPRVAMYSGVKPNGEPYLRADRSHDYWVQLSTARADVVILDASPISDYCPEVVRNLRWMNPEITLLATTLGAYVHPRLHIAVYDAWRDTAGHYYPRLRNAVEDLDGWLYLQSGKVGMTYTNVNLADTLVAKALADVWLEQVVGSKLWDGLFFDLWCTDPRWEQDPADPVDHVRLGYSSAEAYWAAYAAGHRWQAEYLRRRVPVGFLIVGNCGSGGERVVNGWMRENFPKQSGGTWASNMLGFGGRTGYLADDTLYARPSLNWLTMPFDPWPAPITPLGARWARFGLASATLGDGVFAPVGTEWDAYRGFSPWWLDEYAVDECGRSSSSPNDKGWLGRPLGRAYPVGALWRRDFDNGAVLVNPTKQVQQVTIRGGYRFILGSAAPNTGQRVPSTFALAPETAVFLVRAW